MKCRSLPTHLIEYQFWHQRLQIWHEEIWAHEIKSLRGFSFIKTKHKAAVQNLSIWRLLTKNYYCKVFLLFCFSQFSIDMEVNSISWSFKHSWKDSVLKLATENTLCSYVRRLYRNSWGVLDNNPWVMRLLRPFVASFLIALLVPLYMYVVSMSSIVTTNCYYFLNPPEQNSLGKGETCRKDMDDVWCVQKYSDQYLKHVQYKKPLFDRKVSQQKGRFCEIHLLTRKNYVNQKSRIPLMVY